MLAAVSLIAVYIVLTVCKPGLRSVPGYWLAEATSLYRVGMTLRGRFSYEKVELYREYGPAVRIGPDSVSLTDKEIVDDVYDFRTDFGNIFD